MTYEEQIAHAMKLSQENVKKVAEKKVEAKKVEKVEETMTPKVDECDVKKPEDVNEVKETECNSESSDVVVIKSESEDTEDLYSDGKDETVTPKEEKKPEKKVVVVEEVDPVVLSNASQLMMVFNIPEERRADVQRWVKVNLKIGNLGINELLNKFIDEKMNEV